MRKHRRTLQIVLPIFLLLYLVGLFYIATTQTLPSISPFENFDKVIHFFEFFILIVLLMFTFAVYDYKDHRILAFATSLVFIVLSEVSQIPLLSRSFSVADIVADLLGVGFGLLIMYGIDMKWNFLKQFS